MRGREPGEKPRTAAQGRLYYEDRRKKKCKCKPKSNGRQEIGVRRQETGEKKEEGKVKGSENAGSRDQTDDLDVSSFGLPFFSLQSPFGLPILSNR
jgi:hypothetical protein